MLDTTIKSIIDTTRNVLVGKVPNPVSQIDLITIAMIYKFMDDMDNSVIQRGGKASFFKDDLQPYAWHKLLSPALGNEGRISLYSEALEKLQMSKNIPQLFRQIFKGAFLPFRDGATLTMFLKEINKLSYDNSENLGNGFEYLLSIMGSQGDAGQFRTPRHIIDFIVDVVNPSKDDTILDPACGTAGFLISAYKHILKYNSEAFDAEKEVKSYSSQEIEIEHNLNGDMLSHSGRMKLTQNIKGYDISPDMQKLALVNLYLHGFKSPDIEEYDTLTNETKWNDNFDIVLANPPFMTPKGGIQPHKKFSIQANRSEVLFVDYIAEHLSIKGKAGIIVPEGIIFQSTNAYQKLRKKLVEENYLYAVVSLPSGVFNPYSGVKTSILLIDREIAKKSDSILFVDIKNDGFDLGAQRRPSEKNDLPDAFYAIKEFQKHSNENNEIVKKLLSKYEIVNLVKKSDVVENGEFNLSGSRYAETKDYSNCKWKRVKIGDVCSLMTGGTPKSTEESYYKNGTIKWLVSGDIHKAIIKDCDNYITEEAMNNSNAKILPKNSVLIALNGQGKTRGTVALLETEATCNQSIVSINPIDKEKSLISEFLYYQLKFKYEEIRAITGDTHRSGLNMPIIRNIEIILPPVDVQKEIVKELDAYQEVINGAKKVVENWKPTLPINLSWKKVKLKDICEINPKKSQIAELNKNTLVSFVPMEYISDRDTYFEAKEERKLSEVYGGYTYFQDEDVLLAKVTPCFENGKSGIAKNLKNKIGFGSSEFIVLRASKDILSNILYYAISSNNFINNGKEKMTGTGGLKRLPREYVENYEIFIPNKLAEQKEIVAKIEEEEQAIEQCKKLIELHEQKISNKIKSIWGEGC